MTKNDIEKMLRQLYIENTLAQKEGEIPVSAMLWKDGEVLSLAHNQVEKDNNPFHHAEMLVLEEGMKKLSSRYLKNTVLIVTLEPCLTCLGAILKAGVPMLYYVLDDEKRGAFSHYHVFTGGEIMVERIKAPEFKSQMDAFFADLRKTETGSLC